MNTNTNVTSYMPESFWTIIPIFFYTARTVYKKSLVQDYAAASNSYLQNPIEHTGSLFTKSLYFIGKSILYMGMGAAIATDRYNWSRREECKDYVAKVLGGNFTTINAAEFCNKHNSDIPTSLKSALEILKDSSNPELALKFEYADYHAIRALEILKDSSNPLLALKFKYAHHNIAQALEILKDSSNPELALKFEYADYHAIRALEILKDINPELALEFNYADYHAIRALEILKDSDNPELALKFKYAHHNIAQALEILKDSSNPLLALKFRDSSSVKALKILKDINPELALKSNYNENVVFLNLHNDLFEKCNVEESGYNEDCMDDIMTHSNDTANDLLEYANNIDLSQYHNM